MEKKKFGYTYTLLIYILQTFHFFIAILFKSLYITNLLALKSFIVNNYFLHSDRSKFFFSFYYFRYATIYTMFPVFSLVLDKDISGKTALTYPELYKELSKGRSLSFKTFFIWVLISIYQGELLRQLHLSKIKRYT